METFCAKHNLARNSVAFWVGGSQVFESDAISECTSGEHGVVLVVADTAVASELMALGDALRQLAVADHGSAQASFEAACVDGKMGKEQFMRQVVALKQVLFKCRRGPPTYN